MFNDVAQFIVVWIFVLVAYASVGFISLRDVKELSHFEDAIIYFFQVAFVSYDLEIFDVYEPDRPNLKKFGELFMLSFLFVNALILLNVVIAMMADSYGFMANRRIGIYNYMMIKAAPSYANDKHYGALAFLPAPFAVVSFLTIPYYLCVKEKERLRRFTDRFNVSCYFIVSIIISVIFLAINLTLVPFAYLKNCWHKIKLARIS